MPGSDVIVCQSFVQDSDPAWADTASRTFEVTGYPGIARPLLLTVTGRCPRCGGEVVVDHPTVAVAGVAPVSREEVDQLAEVMGDALPAQTLPTEFLVECNCARRHRTPDGTDRAGCGAAWWMRVEPLTPGGGNGDA